MQKYQDELGIGVVPFKLMVYVPDQDTYKPIDEVKEGERTLSISGTELRRRLAEGEEIPEWFSYPEVVAELRRTHPPRHQQGFTVFFTGLSGSGKSTIANALMTRLLELTGRPVTLLDGDVVRTHLSKGLGFSKEDRSINVRRIGYVASEITKHRGIAICAPIAPYEADRQYNRQLISSFGGYIEVFVDTPLEVCEQRDVKGLYAKARAGLIKGFTGIDDPYEPPSNPEIVCRTTEETVEQCVEKILDYLYQEGYLKKRGERCLKASSHNLRCPGRRRPGHRYFLRTVSQRSKPRPLRLTLFPGELFEALGAVGFRSDEAQDLQERLGGHEAGHARDVGAVGFQKNGGRIAREAQRLGQLGLGQVVAAEREPSRIVLTVEPGILEVRLQVGHHRRVGIDLFLHAAAPGAPGAEMSMSTFLPLFFGGGHSLLDAFPADGGHDGGVEKRGLGLHAKRKQGGQHQPAANDQASHSRFR